MTQELGLFSKEVSLNLDINANTLRRWSSELEKEGYEFTKNEKGQRIYYQRDIVALTHFQKLVNKTRDLESAAKAVASRIDEQNNAEMLLSALEEKDDKITLTRQELDAYIQKAAEEAALKTAEHLFRKFDNVIEQRDRQLLQNLDKTIEEKRLSLHQQEEKPASIFGRFWPRQKNNRQ